jgi:hypothetical protein
MEAAGPDQEERAERVRAKLALLTAFAANPNLVRFCLGGIAILIVREVKAGEGEDLPSLVPELLELFLTPFIGITEAASVACS